MNEAIKLSCLGHTWILDIDGTIVKHNGYKNDGKDTLLDGIHEFFAKIPENDLIILLTARTEDKRINTEQFLKENGVRYDYIIFGAPLGERILINDNKPSGLCMGYCINTERDRPKLNFVIDESL